MKRAARGFTLIELVMVVTLCALIAVLIAAALSRPLDGVLAQMRRAALVDAAALASARLQRDVHEAVPNSLRISSDGQALELLHASGVARYVPNRSTTPVPALAAGTASSCLPSGNACNLLRLLDPAVSVSGVRWLVLYNIGAESGGVPLTGSNVWSYANPGVITPTGSSFTLASGATSGESWLQVTLPSGTSSFSFHQPSPMYRLYLADMIIGYRCTGGSLWRYTYSTLSPGVPAGIPVGASSARMASDLASCTLDYRRGTGSRAGLVTLKLQLSRNGETIELLQQVHVDHVP